jgi:hypothetical protein
MAEERSSAHGVAASSWPWLWLVPDDPLKASCHQNGRGEVSQLEIRSSRRRIRGGTLHLP